MVTTLGNKLVNGKKEQERDIASIGLKTAVAELPSRPAREVVKQITLTLISGLDKKVCCACASYTLF